METRPYRLYGASALAALAQRLADSLADWRAAWGGEPPALTVLPAAERAALGRDVQWHWRSWRLAEGGLIWAATQDGFGRAFAASLFGAQTGWSASEPDHSIAGALGRDALDALVMALWQELGLHAYSDQAVDGQPDPALFRHGRGGLLIELGWSAGRILLLCDGSNLVPRGTVRPRPAPAALADSLRSAPLRLAVDLGEVNLTLGQLQSLGLGDVLCLGTPLERPLEVRAEGQPFCRAQLGASDGHRAVALVKK
ncbi:FliM/FliN family flagellar motor switch protein [Chitinimonas lacunae]|uniref:FliM/FliN family flagellar motor switch protein n=1 Tax=Chitinimonas lacunae TaxID=1963018 RepID=A0ABV8MWZ6_9NEIS